MTWNIADIAHLPTWAVMLLVSTDVIIRVALLGIVPGNRRPAVAMAWLLIIFFFPIPGLLLFLMLGSFKLGGARRKRLKDVHVELASATDHLDLPDQLEQAPNYVAASAKLTRRLTGFPMLDGNSFEFITDYRENMRRMAEDIDAAEDYVHIMFYIMALDPEENPGYADLVFEALKRAHQRGVKVRLLYDHIGTLRTSGYRELKKWLDEAGFEHYPAIPFKPLRGHYQRPDLRNHRKMLVIDGLIGYTGSINLVEPGYKRASSHKKGREWVDFMARMRGPMVASLDVVFGTDWYAETGEPLQPSLRGLTADEIDDHDGPAAQMIASGPGFPQENNLRAFNHLLYNAQENIKVVSPYLVPDDSMLYALTTAALRGVNVELVVCRKADQFMVQHAQQSYYEQLLSAGVRIHRYPDPDVLHSKLFTVDDEVGVFGSSNMDMRSFSLNMEVTVLTIGDQPVGDLNRIFEKYLAQCEELDLETWQSRPKYKRWLDNVFRLTAALQ